MQRIIAGSRQVGYTLYTMPTQEEDWRRAVAALSQGFLDRLSRHAAAPEISLLVVPHDDPAVAYGLELSRRRRAQRVPMVAFLAQTKIYRHSFEVHLSPLRDVTRKHVGTEVTLMGITERARAEAQLQESRRQILALSSNLLGMAYRCRNDER